MQPRSGEGCSHDLGRDAARIWGRMEPRSGECSHSRSENEDRSATIWGGMQPQSQPQSQINRVSEYEERRSHALRMRADATTTSVDLRMRTDQPQSGEGCSRNLRSTSFLSMRSDAATL
jgi:hypothetical protein